MNIHYTKAVNIDQIYRADTQNPNYRILEKAMQKPSAVVAVEVKDGTHPIQVYKPSGSLVRGDKFFKNEMQEFYFYNKKVFIPVELLRKIPGNLDLSQQPKYDHYTTHSILVQRDYKGKLKVLCGYKTIAKATEAGYDLVAGAIIDSDCTHETKSCMIETFSNASECVIHEAESADNVLSTITLEEYHLAILILSLLENGKISNHTIQFMLDVGVKKARTYMKKLKSFGLIGSFNEERVANVLLPQSLEDIKNDVWEFLIKCGYIKIYVPKKLAGKSDELIFNESLTALKSILTDEYYKKLHAPFNYPEIPISDLFKSARSLRERCGYTVKRII
jgi:hypothetical protein